MNPQKMREKTANHVNADANITCNFGDGDIIRLGVPYLTHAIHNYLDYSKIANLPCKYGISTAHV